MAANIPALDEAPGTLSQQVIHFIKEHTFRLFGRSAATLPEAIAKQVVQQVVYIPTKTKVIIEANAVDTSSSATDHADTIALTQPFLSFVHPAFAILCFAILVASTAFLLRARAVSRRPAISDGPILDEQQIEETCKEVAAWRPSAALEKMIVNESNAKKNERDALVAEGSNKDAKIVELELKIKKQTAEFTAATSSASTVKETLEALKKEQRIVGEVQAAAQKLSGERDKRLAVLEAREVKYTNQATEIGSSREAKKTSNLTITSLRANAEKSRLENEERQSALQTELATVRNENTALKTAAHKEDEKQSAMQTELDTARNENTAHSIDSRKKDEKQSAMQTELDTARNENTALTIDSRKKDEKQSTMQMELDTARNENTALTIDARKKDEELKALRTAEKSTAEQMTTLLSQIEAGGIANDKEQRATEQAATIKIESMAKRAKEAESSLHKALAEESGRMKATIASLELRNEELVAANGTLLSENDRLVSTNEAFANDYTCVVQEKAAADAALEKLTTEHDTLKTARAKLANFIVGMKNEKIEIESASKTLQDRHATVAAAHTQLLSRSNVMEDENTELRSSVERLEEQLKEKLDASNIDHDFETSTSFPTSLPPPPPPPSDRSPETPNGETGHGSTDTMNGEQPRTKRPKQRGRKHTGGMRTFRANATATTATTAAAVPAQQSDSGPSTPFSMGSASLTPARPIPTDPAQLIPTSPAHTAFAGPNQSIPTGAARPIPTNAAHSGSSSLPPLTPTGPSHSFVSGPAQFTPPISANTSFSNTSFSGTSLTPTAPSQFIPSVPAQFNITSSSRPIPTGPSRPSIGPARPKPTRRGNPLSSGPTSSMHNRPARQVSEMDNSIWAARGSTPLPNDRQR